MGRLTDRAVKTVRAGRHGDGDGLHLVSESGRRKWVLRYQMRGARRDMGLGPYPAGVSLSEARIAAGDARKLIAKGIDPLGARRSARKAEKPVPTFGEIAQLVIADAKRKSPRSATNGSATLALSTADRCSCGPCTRSPRWTLPPYCVWHDKPEVARKLYPAIRRVFEHARIRLRDDHGIAMPDNPAQA